MQDLSALDSELECHFFSHICWPKQVRTAQGSSLVVQGLRLHLLIQGFVDLIPGWGAKIPHAWWPKYQKHETEGIL